MRVPAGMRNFEWELPHDFLGLDERGSDFENAAAVILPVPYEATVSYGGGTGKGPAAIIDASRYVELYDQELDCEPAQVGIATLPALSLSGAGGEQALGELRRGYEALLDAAPGKFVIVLGGEHALSSAPILAWADRLASAGRRLTVLQFDAHTDLRPEYEGSRFSHASVMYQVQERVNIVAVGIRALTSEEMALVRGADHLRVFLADDIQGRDDWQEEVMRALGDDIYLSFDVDVFDPALLPATGTPEPGGLQWYPVLKLLRRVFRERTVHAADVVELAPIPGMHAPDFLVAKLVYKLIGYRFRNG